MSEFEDKNICALCFRKDISTTKHHFYPKAFHSNKRIKNKLNEDIKKTILICRLCHDCVHATLTERELLNDYNTLESLLANPYISKFVEWVRDKPNNLIIKNKQARRKRKW